MLFIPFSDYTSIGGPSTFMRNLRHYLDERSFEYSNQPNKSTGIFFPIQYDLHTLRQYKKNGGAILQRLDGVYYPSKHGQDYRRRNKAMKEIYLDLADLVIFQSHHSRDQCFEMFGEKKGSVYSIIVNGVNKSVFYPELNPRRIEKDKFRLVTTGNFRNEDMLKPLVLALDKLVSQVGFELKIIGPVHKSLEILLDRKYVKWDGPCHPNQLAESLRGSDIFLYSHLNPPCPNSVVEAVSTGLPVVGFDSGAMSELCFFSKELLVPVSNQTFQVYEGFDHEKLSELILFALHNFDRFKENALQHSNLYGFNAMGEQYVRIFDRMHANASPISFPSWSSTIKGIYQRLIK